jgi:hypothetical protein
VAVRLGADDVAEDPAQSAENAAEEAHETWLPLPRTKMD